MWTILLDVFSILILAAWGIFLLVVIAFVVMAAFEFLKTLAVAALGVAFAIARYGARVGIRHADAKAMHDLGIRR